MSAVLEIVAIGHTPLGSPTELVTTKQNVPIKVGTNAGITTLITSLRYTQRRQPIVESTQPPEPRAELVLSELRTNEVPYRTVQSLALASGLLPDAVESVLRNSPSVRKALFQHSDGSNIYTERSTPRSLREALTFLNQLVLDSYR